MKKILTLALISFSLVAKAQTSTGNMMLGGSISITSTNYKTSNDNDNSGFGLAPSFGYFIKDNFAIGASVSLNSGRFGTGPNESKTFGFGVGPFVRLYKFTSSDQFAFFGQGGISINSSRTESGNLVTDRVSSVAFSVSPGFAYFFNEHWAGEFAFSLLSVTSANHDNNGSDRTSVNFGLNSFNPSVGIRYHMGN